MNKKEITSIDQDFLKPVSEVLKFMRRFYNIYSHDQIGETVFTQFENLPAVSTGRKFYLSCSHYLTLG